MKKAILLVLLLVFGFAGLASATTWVDTYQPDSSPLYMTAGQTESIHFDLTTVGFDPFWLGGSDFAVWAQTTIYVADDFRITWDLSDWIDNFDLFGSDESLSVITDGIWFDYNEESYDVDFHSLVYDIDIIGLMSLNFNFFTPGELNLTLTAIEGDFYFYGASLTAGDTAPVPEPATILLLGGGLAGLAFYRRKRK